MARDKEANALFLTTHYFLCEIRSRSFHVKSIRAISSFRFAWPNARTTNFKLSSTEPSGSQLWGQWNLCTRSTEKWSYTLIGPLCVWFIPIFFNKLYIYRVIKRRYRRTMVRPETITVLPCNECSCDSRCERRKKRACDTLCSNNIFFFVSSLQAHAIRQLRFLRSHRQWSAHK